MQSTSTDKHKMKNYSWLGLPLSLENACWILVMGK